MGGNVDHSVIMSQGIFVNWPTQTFKHGIT